MSNTVEKKQEGKTVYELIKVIKQFDHKPYYKIMADGLYLEGSYSLSEAEAYDKWKALLQNATKPSITVLERAIVE